MLSFIAVPSSTVSRLKNRPESRIVNLSLPVALGHLVDQHRLLGMWLSFIMFQMSGYLACLEASRGTT